MSENHPGPATGKHLGPSLALTLAFVAGEATAGYLSNSLALLSDAGHNFADALALGLSWYAVRVARRPADARRTFGYHRAGILAALLNAAALVAIAAVIFWEAAQRFRQPEPVHSGVMVGMAVGAVLLNGVISLWLRAEAGHDLNIRSAYLHMLGDAVSAVGVALAGVVVWLTGETLADPAVSVLIGLFILWTSWGVLKESVHILMEGVPAGLDLDALAAALARVPGVRGVHDLHVWAVSSGVTACSCHLVVGEEAARDGRPVLAAATAVLREQFHVAHTTVQVEAEGGCPDEPRGEPGGAGTDGHGAERAESAGT